MASDNCRQVTAPESVQLITTDDAPGSVLIATV
jgi:hypothetical protein